MTIWSNPSRLYAIVIFSLTSLSLFAATGAPVDLRSDFRAGKAEILSVSAFHPFWPPTHLFDGDPSTLYRSESINPAVVEIRFEHPMTIAETHLLPTSAWGNPAYRWRLEGVTSARAEDPRTAVYELLIDWTESASDEWSKVVLSDAASITSLRLTVERLTGDDFVHLNQWSLFSPAGEEIEIFADRFQPEPVQCLLTKPSQMLLVHVGERAECQDASVEEAVEFLKLHSHLELIWREQDHPFVMPPERWGGVFLMPWDLEQRGLPFFFNTLTTLWQCERDNPDLGVWAAGGAIGADFGVRGAALASVPMHGCGIWWTCAGPAHGFQNWAAQIIVHEIRNTISWWYETECVDAGAPSLLGPYDYVKPEKNYCSQFNDLHDCYVAWFEDMRRGLRGQTPLYPRLDLVAPSVDAWAVPIEANPRLMETVPYR